MCERLKQAVLKTALPERVTGVRIPLPTPSTCRAVRVRGFRYENLLGREAVATQSTFLPSKRQICRAMASAARMARCIMVNVGLALPEDGKTEALAILRFSIRCTLKWASTTEFEGLVPIRVEPAGWARSIVKFTIPASELRTSGFHSRSQTLARWAFQ